MTSPQPLRPDQRQPDYTDAEQVVLTALTIFFASKLAVSAMLLPVRLAAKLTDLGLSSAAVRAAGRLVLAPPLTGRGRFGSPSPDAPFTTMSRQTKAEEPRMRAQFVLDSAKRITTASADDGPDSTATAVRVEATYLDAHRAAGQNRARAAAALDRAGAAAGPGGKLRWVAVADERTTADCAALDGTLFAFDDPPGGLIPGAVHARCRCSAVPAVDIFSDQPTVSAS